MKKSKFVGVNGDEIFLREGKNNTVVEIGKIVSFLPFDIDQTVEFIKKLGIIK
ncbi:hypothetical protein [Fusobacterium varium]|uniref:hypothetical protein n=1 Tax=Fusobacterium varium TaxID=856 RepID=UPI0035663B11